MLAKKIAKASAVTVVFVILFQCLGIAIHALFARVYGPEGLGLYASFMMFLSLYSMVAIFGIPAAISKYIAEYEERQEHDKIRKSFSSVLIFVTLTSLITGLLAYYITPYAAKVMHIKAASKMAIFLSVSLPFFIYTQVSQSFYLGFLNALKSSLIRLVSLIGILCVGLYAYFFVRIPVYYAIVFGFAVSGVVGLLLCIKDKVIVKNFSKEELYKILKFALPIALMSYFGFIARWVDRIALGIYLGVAEIGIFTAGMTIIAATRQLPGVLRTVLIPSYSKISVYGKSGLERAFNIHIKLSAIFLFLAGSLTFLYSKHIVSILYGPEFVQTTTILRILSVGTFLTAVTIPASTLITGSGHPKLNLYLNLIGIPTQIILIFFLTKHYGISGTATANLLAGLVYVFGTIFIVRKILKIRIYWENLAKAMFAFILFVGSYLLIFLILHNSVVAGIVGAAVYAFICWRIVLSTEDKNMIRKIGGKS